jgi:hypothetical protein
MSPTPHEKGNVLEAAVAAIEGCILATSPALRDKTFVIESKKIINVGDVHHEIDIFVTIDLGRGYQSIFIFECKNWQDSVGKNEVIVLSEKIDAADATKGFLVAKSFTKDAHAQAAKDTRITLLTAAEHDPAATPIPFDLHTIITIPQHLDLTFHSRGSTGREFTDVQMDTAQARLFGNPTGLRQYVSDWASSVCADDVCTFRTESLPEGDYERTGTAERRFEAGHLSIDDREVERAEISVRYKVRVLHPAVVSSFEVESRGRHLLLAPVQLPEGPSIQLSVTSL